MFCSNDPKRPIPPYWASTQKQRPHISQAFPDYQPLSFVYFPFKPMRSQPKVGWTSSSSEKTAVWFAPESGRYVCVPILLDWRPLSLRPQAVGRRLNSPAFLEMRINYSGMLEGINDFRGVQKNNPSKEVFIFIGWVAWIAQALESLHNNSHLNFITPLPCRDHSCYDAQPSRFTSESRDYIIIHISTWTLVVMIWLVMLSQDAKCQILQMCCSVYR